MGRILKYLRGRELAMVGASLVFIVCQVWLDLKMPDYMSEITTLVQTPGSQMADVWRAGGKMLLCALGSLLSSVATGYFAARIAAGFAKRLRGLVFDRVEDFSMEEINRFSTASLITRSTNDITQIQMVIAMGMQVLIKAPILAVWAVLKIAGKSWQWTASTAAAVGVLVLLILFIMLLALPKFKRIQTLTDNLNRVTRENLTGLRVVRAYNAEEYQQRKFERANEELTRSHLFTGRLVALLHPGMNLVMSSLSLAIYWTGAYLIDRAGAMEKLPLFSEMVVFSSYAMQVVMAFTMMTMIFILLPRAQVSARRILEVLDTHPRIVDGAVTDSPAGQEGRIVLDHVSFRYPGAAAEVLQDINLTIEPGQTVAVIGSTGSGKSTLLNLIARFYDATGGRVMVDGVDVKDYNLSSLRHKIGYVPQKAVLFSGTIASNISYGDNGRGPADGAQIEQAARVAQAEEFIEKIPERYEGRVAQGGANLSGGQKQRLSIARAVCRRPEIYLFDDSFSALDYRTDRQVRSQLSEQTRGATRIIVAQRIGTIQDADQIVVLDRGRMVGLGTHKQLLESCEVYQQIAYSQLSKEELADA